MALVTDYTLATYDSFFTIVEMDSFIAIIGSDIWAALSDEDKEYQIILAVNFVNGLTWQGTLNVDVIAPSMMWPRSGLTYSNGIAVPDDETPDNIGMLMACFITNSASAMSTGDIKKKTVGAVTVEYETGTTAQSDSCIDTYAPSSWIRSPMSYSIGSVGLGRYP